MTKHMKKNLLIVANSFNSFGGGERWTLELSRRIGSDFNVSITNFVSSKDRRKIDCSVNEAIKKSKSRIVTINCLGVENRQFGYKYVLRIPDHVGLFRLANEIKKADIVYQISFNPYILSSVVFFSKVFRKRLIVGGHNPVLSHIFKKNAKIDGIYIRSILGLASAFHAVNREDAEMLGKYYSHKKVYFIPNFLYSVHKLDKFDHRDFTALFVGRLATWEKGIDLLAKIISRTAVLDPNIKFVVVGEGREGQQIIEKLKRKYQNFDWLGFVSDAKLTDIYRNSSLFVLPSRIESFSLVTLEAQGFGLPIVSFDINGPMDIIEKSFQGRLVKPFDTDEFVEAVVDYHRLWKKNRNTYNNSRKRIKEFIERKYSDKNIIPKIKKMLE